LHSVSGSIEAQGVAAAGTLDVENVSGRMTFKNIQANAMNARTVSGRIEVETTLGDGPYRFNDSRTDFRFYTEHNIAYYRLVELLTPQAISEWYLGSGYSRIPHHYRHGSTP
jgi:hypothetical protein